MKAINKNKKGVALIITFFIMIIILAVTLSVSTILYSEAKIIRNIGNSVVAFYAADSGIEKVLYYDRQVNAMNNYGSCTCEDDSCSCEGNSVCVDKKYCVDPCDGEGKCSEGFIRRQRGCVPRGLCSMLYSKSNEIIYCEKKPATILDGNIYCEEPELPEEPKCAINNCIDCTISFSTDMGDGVKYSVEAFVKSSEPSEYLNISSKGEFGGAARKINIYQKDQYPK